jgi:hypothetical protein
MRMTLDADAAVSEIELIVGLAQQCDSLEPQDARRLRAEVMARLQALRAALLADERELRLHGHGDNHVVPTLTEITRARSALRVLETAIESRLGDRKSADAENLSPARWAS